jgi:hypothetical protein
MPIKKIDGYNVRVPKGGLSSRAQTIAANYIKTEKSGLKKDDKCAIVVFKGQRAAQRCEGRTLAKNTTAAQRAARSRFGKAAKSCKGKGKGIAKCVKGKL